ncbi:tyrosine-type recombinase/integrase [Eubacterium sp. MSJ-13]|uniref:tyrosine-type recombinase/integrase n=1 Tax=Eubacterium sp. MSJ-13 TaxID=2841513 RepID=UPI001C100FED|nr:tyrosine-type recombinase/integrase [Eubacterium sp. MSJ-13]MBU5478002.1 tyrosine-type recombinase/integrase [Eubacterium sp. MSJ-13]
MKTTQPIRDIGELDKIKKYYCDVKPNKRNWLLIICGLNTALRISDILKLRWKDVYNEGLLSFKSHIDIKEQKTGKKTTIFINNNLKEALASFLKDLFAKKINLAELMERFIFLGQKSGNKPISRIQAFRIISHAAEKCQLGHRVSSHSLRKTFGYHAWKKGVSPALLTSIYNHSSYKITTRYLGIDQDDRDEVFGLVNL